MEPNLFKIAKSLLLPLAIFTKYSWKYPFFDRNGKFDTNIINYRFLTTKTNLKALYSSLFVHNLTSKAICSECEDFCLQFSKKNHILEMKAHSETHLENENMFQEE